MNTPIVFIIFNRPAQTSRVFQAIAQAKPKKLFVIADGPRNEAETQKCVETRAIIDRVNWDCEVITNYSEQNLGCRKRIKSGLDWVFEQVESAIILEDDCLPSSSFFHFCEQLLKTYDHDERVMMISGNNYLPENCKIGGSYYFSRDAKIWGWATWRRAWQKYVDDINVWRRVGSAGWLEEIFDDPIEFAFWQHRFSKAFEGKVDSWGLFWSFTCLINNGLVIRPEKNLVMNIGFGDSATHTQQKNLQSEQPADEIKFPLQHPTEMLPNLRLDRCEFQRLVLKRNKPNGQKHLKNLIYKTVSKVYDLRLKIKLRGHKV